MLLFELSRLRWPLHPPPLLQAASAMPDIASSSKRPDRGAPSLRCRVAPVQLEGHSLDAMTNESSRMCGVSFGFKGIQVIGQGFSTVGCVANTLAERLLQACEPRAPAGLVWMKVVPPGPAGSG